MIAGAGKNRDCYVGLRYNAHQLLFLLHFGVTGQHRQLVGFEQAFIHPPADDPGWIGLNIICSALCCLR
jgi:hypothetical protein